MVVTVVTEWVPDIVLSPFVDETEVQNSGRVKAASGSKTRQAHSGASDLHHCDT